jgi:hypothetical protein
MRDPAVRGAFGVLRRPEAWLNQDGLVMLAPLRWQQPSLFGALADIPEDKAWWNPLRDARPQLEKKGG